MSQETPNWDNSRRIMLKVPSSPLPSRPRTYIESNTQQSEKLEEAEAPSAPSAPSTPHWDDIDGTDGADGAVGKDGAVGADGASQWSDTLSARTDEKKIGYTVVIISLRVCTWVYMLHFNTSFICIFFVQWLQQPCRLRPLLSGGSGALSDLSKEGCPERRGEPIRFNALSTFVESVFQCVPSKFWRNWQDMTRTWPDRTCSRIILNQSHSRSALSFPV